MCVVFFFSRRFGARCPKEERDESPSSERSSSRGSLLCRKERESKTAHRDDGEGGFTMMIIVVLEEVPFAVLFFLFRSIRGQKSPLLGENYYCAGEKK